MKMAIIYGLAGLVSLIALLFLMASLRPKDWSFQKSFIINAPKSEVWTVVSDLNRYNEWNPYLVLEPGALGEAKGPAATSGSTYSWNSAKAGEGIITTTSVSPTDRIEFKFDFIRPFKAINVGVYALSDFDGATKMIWTMSGRYDGFFGLIGRVMSMVIGLERLLGKDWEVGLNRLKEICEKKSRA